MSDNAVGRHLSRKRRRLTLEMKLDIIKRCHRGETPSEIGRSLDLNRSTICTILKDKERILDYVQGCASMQSTMITKKRINSMREVANVVSAESISKLELRNPPLKSMVEERTLIQYSYPSHISKPNGSSATSSQPSYGDPTLSLILTETRLQTAEMRVAMGQLSDKIDNIMNKINQVSQYQCQKWWTTTGIFQEDSEKRDEWLGEEKGHKITKMKLLAKIISIEEKCEILEKENISLKKDLDKATTKLLDFETDQLARISDSVKTALSSVYFDVENKFSNGVEYEGSDIRKTIASSIKEMTQDLNGITVEEKMGLNSCKRIKLEKSSTLGKRKRKPKAKAKPNSMEVSQKDSENNVTDLSRFIEMDPESPKSDCEERWKHAFQKPSDILESTLILQDEVITLREESCSTMTSKTGCKGKDIDPDPSPPQTLDVGLSCESNEEWIPP